MLELTRTLSLPVVALVAGYTCSLDGPLHVWPWWPDVHLSGDVVGLGGLVYSPCFGNRVASVAVLHYWVALVLT